MRLTMMFVEAQVIFLLGACSNSPSDPPQDTRNPGSFHWTRDTIGDGSFQSDLNRLWGSSASDVYAVGHSSETASGKIRHFDGVVWTDHTLAYLTAFASNFVGYYLPTDVKGFGFDDVWIVGGGDTSSIRQAIQTGFILRGSVSQGWQGITLPGAYIHLSVGGVAFNDVWVGGYGGQMYHYDGTHWQEFWVGESVAVSNIAAVRSDEVYASAWDSHGGITYVKYFRWNGIEWSLSETHIESASSPSPGISFCVVGSQLVSTNGRSVLKRNGPGSWEVWYTNPEAHFLNVFAGGKWIYVAGQLADGTEALFYSEGAEWKRVPQVSRSGNTLWAVWATDEAAFAISTPLSANSTTFPLQFVVQGK